MARNTQGNQTGRQQQNPDQQKPTNQEVDRGDRQNQQPQNTTEEEE